MIRDISSIMRRVLNVIFDLIIILKIISLFLLAYYYVLTKTLTMLHDKVFHKNIDHKMLYLKDIYEMLNNILALSVAFVCVIIFNPYYIIDYKIDSKFKHMLYYYGLVVIYDSIFYYILEHGISRKFTHA